MYFGPLGWPPLRVWIGALAMTILFTGLAALGLDITILVIAAFVAVLVIAAPRRAKDLGAEEMRDSRPDE
ncbi:MAG TPA: hypothetical protein VFY04_11685 [Solirubrobacterales bacterium]|nr:hypothetical protein [Solirubrobacterales bacterium]